MQITSVRYGFPKSDGKDRYGTQSGWISKRFHELVIEVVTTDEYEVRFLTIY